jgi:hypothetical protein
MKWFVLIVGIAFAVGCQRQPQPRSPAPMDQHANSLAADHPAEHGSHSVHSESAPFRLHSLSIWSRPVSLSRVWSCCMKS